MSASLNYSSQSFANASRPSSLPVSAITLWSAVHLTLCYVATSTNLLLVNLILSKDRLRTGCGLLIAHCLIAHTVRCMISYPIIAITIYGKQLNHWNMDPKYCALIMWIQQTSSYASNWAEPYIAANRVVALYFPYKYRAFANRKVENVNMVIVWVCAGGLAGLGCFDLGVQYILRAGLGSCTVLQKDTFGMVTFMIGYYIPLGAAGVGYVLVYVKMLADKHKNNRAVDYDRQSPDKTIQSKRLQKAKAVFVCYAWNAACYLIMPVAITTEPTMPVRHPLLLLWLGSVQMLGYVTNPLIFLAMSTDYRVELRRIVNKLRCGTASAKEPSSFSNSASVRFTKKARPSAIATASA